MIMISIFPSKFIFNFQIKKSLLKLKKTPINVLIEISAIQGGIKYFTSWEPRLSAKNFARNSVSQMRQKTSKIALNWEFLPMTRNF